MNNTNLLAEAYKGMWSGIAYPPASTGDVPGTVITTTDGTGIGWWGDDPNYNYKQRLYEKKVQEMARLQNPFIGSFNFPIVVQKPSSIPTNKLLLLL